MSLKDYAVSRDNFVAENATFGGFSFPCVACIHRSRRDNEYPCRECDHNVNAVADPDDYPRPDEDGAL